MRLKSFVCESCGKEENDLFNSVTIQGRRICSKCYYYRKPED